MAKKKKELFSFALLGKKLGMTQIFQEDGDVVPVTILQLGPCVVTQVKTAEKDGYNAVQIGFDDKKKQRIIKAEAGHAKASKAPVKRFIRELRLDEKTLAEYSVGQVLTAELLKSGDRVDVTGTSIGKGFAGVMKRHNFSGKDAAHGTHEHFRHGGSIGMRSIPGKVFKNKKMGGHMGDETVTTQNLKVAEVQADKNIVMIKGAIPGSKNGYIYLKASVKGGFEARSLTASSTSTSEATAE